MDPALAAALYITVHTVDGLVMSVNPKQIVALRDARDAEQRIVHGKVRCIITTTDGKYISAAETCDEVRKLIGD